MNTLGRAAAFAAVVALGGALAAGAQGPPAAGEGRRGLWHERRAARLAEYLGLDAGQKTAVQQLQEQHREEMKAVWEEGRELRKKLRDATEAEKSDAQAVGEAMLALKAHRERAKAGRAEFEKKLTALLTPEQKQKFEALKAARGFGRRGRGPGQHGFGRRGQL
jgi:Spy/CpxP family protein refolding chaperone